MRALLVIGLLMYSPLHAQQAPRPSLSWAALLPAKSHAPLVTVPDSVRRKVGYQHWKGGAIGGVLGALGGLALALGSSDHCDDCTSNPAPTGKVTLVGAGIGGALGFLAGLATPRYRWVPATDE